MSRFGVLVFSKKRHCTLTPLLTETKESGRMVYGLINALLRKVQAFLLVLVNCGVLNCILYACTVSLITSTVIFT